jgi:hypothetical protein
MPPRSSADPPGHEGLVDHEHDRHDGPAAKQHHLRHALRHLEQPMPRSGRAQLAQHGHRELHEHLRLVREHREQFPRAHVRHDGRRSEQLSDHDEVRPREEDLGQLRHADPHASSELLADKRQRHRRQTPGHDVRKNASQPHPRHYDRYSVRGHPAQRQ